LHSGLLLLLLDADNDEQRLGKNGRTDGHLAPVVVNKSEWGISVGQESKDVLVVDVG
jgi:hypothetical protein